MAFFGGNPFATPVGQRIEQATDASLASENWALNMEICDIINESEDGPKDAIKAIRKRLHQNVGKNYTVVMYTLTVLETAVKNCGRRFHLLATNKEFVQELVKLIGPKNDPPTAVQEKVLSLIQSWADAFKKNPEMNGVVQVYQDLKMKGVEFPMTDLDALAPILTPQKTVADAEPIPRPNQIPVCQPSAGSPVSAAVPRTTSQIMFNSDQMGKLRSELDVVQCNVRVLNEMLSELTPGQEHPSDLELLQDLYTTLQSMQGRIVKLLSKSASEEVTNELLRVNDELNNVFLRYSRFEKNRSGSQQQQPQTPNARTHADIHSGSDVPPLIDLGEPEHEIASAPSDIHLQLAGLTVNSVNTSTMLSQVSSVAAQHGSSSAEDEFDMFAQSRQANYESSKQSGSSYEDNIRVDQVGMGLGAVAQSRPTQYRSDEEDYFDETLQRESDFHVMEDWLQDKVEKSPDDDHEPQQSITSSEFDRFLAERATAIDMLPSANTTAPSRQNPRRQIEKEETENRLFAL